MSTIDLLRHGEPEGGVRYRGDGVDDRLSERGWAQMWAAVGEFSDWTHVVSSPLLRCRCFAEAVAQRHELPLAKVPEDRVGGDQDVPCPGVARQAAAHDARHKPHASNGTIQGSAHGYSIASHGCTSALSCRQPRRAA